MKKLKDTFKLRNGNTIPCIGFGTWQIPDGDIAINAVKKAIEVGYRHIDTAFCYENERSVGKAMRECGVPREEIFVTSKLWNTFRGYDMALKGFELSMNLLGLDYLDLFLIHWPCHTEDGDAINKETWRAFEELYKDGRIRNIGVSNFKVHHLKPLLESAEIKPVVNQIEIHPGFMQKEVVDFCHQNDIVVESWGPLGQGAVLNNETLVAIAKKYNHSVAQLCIRWCLQINTLPLPKTATMSRIEENVNVFDFVISDEDMNIINALSNIGSSGLDPDTVQF